MGLRGKEWDQPIRTAKEMGNGDSVNPRDYDLDDLDDSQAVSQAPGSRNANGANGGYMKTNQVNLPHCDDEVEASEMFGGPYENIVKQENEKAGLPNALRENSLPLDESSDDVWRGMREQDEQDEYEKAILDCLSHDEAPSRGTSGER